MIRIRQCQQAKHVRCRSYYLWLSLIHSLTLKMNGPAWFQTGCTEEGETCSVDDDCCFGGCLENPFHPGEFCCAGAWVSYSSRKVYINSNKWAIIEAGRHPCKVARPCSVRNARSLGSLWPAYITEQRLYAVGDNQRL